MDRKDINKIIRACAEKAREKGFKVFGIQFYTACWSGPGAETTYPRDGVSVDCNSGVGKSGANFVYKFGDYGERQIQPRLQRLLRFQNGYGEEGGGGGEGKGVETPGRSLLPRPLDKAVKMLQIYPDVFFFCENRDQVPKFYLN